MGRGKAKGKEHMNCNCGHSIGHPLVPKCTCKTEWVGLTVDEILSFYKDHLDRTMFVHIIKSVETKLKEKNT